ncbi:hypothetical protein CoNPh11_CDS0222 [Staphylococcus phage S-CoN_Ph11]|nr:hypothetical protein CoNPh2_CDS0152 [Staphylococcus phage S-CoN_Ph2]WNM51866.1 hypothetical protein CoNPh3_CDS0152 [Staphylococcus phage S-CoN_Ph3]WNM52365.1 hypothetical protein CoNPh6_CDS0155 [Staphylococcus phage S-CoN_Ph6]WNM52545.1 hypothetical protein CoNPh7_CDS0173 [Staphylococcus phage S-CoN_Ph7]WNM53279.1 hypothetical protein CoNPh11_CDS0222 [Staphylococcus phage S-CoN_Ph11]WNM53446.1 hypothetical protein CoNPh12_CDS0159 [Staphylococcus phage S-CoN_Ph12]WNM56019.1 hypothetical pro
MKEIKLDDLMSVEQIKEQLTILGSHLWTQYMKKVHH